MCLNVSEISELLHKMAFWGYALHICLGMKMVSSAAADQG